jgi:hypothetical protein
MGILLGEKENALTGWPFRALFLLPAWSVAGEDQISGGGEGAKSGVKGNGMRGMRFIFLGCESSSTGE